MNAQVSVGTCLYLPEIYSQHGRIAIGSGWCHEVEAGMAHCAVGTIIAFSASVSSCKIPRTANLHPWYSNGNYTTMWACSNVCAAKCRISRICVSAPFHQHLYHVASPESAMPFEPSARCAYCLIALSLRAKVQCTSLPDHNCEHVLLKLECKSFLKPFSKQLHIIVVIKRVEPDNKTMQLISKDHLHKIGLHDAS